MLDHLTSGWVAITYKIEGELLSDTDHRRHETLNHRHELRAKPMSWQKVRPVALAVVRRGEEVLLSEHHDPGEDYWFYRPLGGAIEFGEHSSEAVVREFEEELDVTLTDISLLETIENVFTFDGNQGHEIWRLYEGEIEEGWPYEQDRFTAHEPEFDEEFEVVWKHPEDFIDGEEVIYPENLPELL